MKTSNAVAALGALAQDTRLRAFRLLVERGPDGLPAGQLASALGVPPSSLTFHLQQLLHAGLVMQRRASRNLIYATNIGAMEGLVAYLTENCCGRGAACAPACDPATASGAALPASDAA
jgi:ArsR family transcriptional regulator, arsenate/arsenite/antimonite-responsive transcriptional repressor